MPTRLRFFMMACLLCCGILLSACNEKSETAKKSSDKVPPECENAVSTSERYWQIYGEILKDPKKGPDLDRELKGMKTPSGLSSARISLGFVVQDEYGCWLHNDHYYCSDIEDNREDFLQEMKYLWSITSFYDFNEEVNCLPYLEAVYHKYQN